MNRRDLVKTLAGAAGLPAVASGALRRVGIVGSGMAGVSLAWMLDQQRDVVLLESQSTVGGNVQSIPVTVDNQTVVVDMGAQYFHPALYPTYVKLLGRLGLMRDVRSFPASITLFANGATPPLFVSPVLPGRAWPLLADWNRAGIQAFGVAFSAAKERENTDASYSLTLGEWLPALGLTQAQWEGMVLPWAASLYSGDIEQARGMSARAAMVFAAKALPDNPTGPIPYYFLHSGMAEPLRQMLARTRTVETLTSAPVSSVTRDGQGGFVIRYGNGRQTRVAEVVFASSGPGTRQLLAGVTGTDALQAALAQISFHDTRLALHTDPAYAPAEQPYWSFFNGRIDGKYCEASMWLQDVVGANVWKSWVTHRTSPPVQVLQTASYRHMLPTPGSISGQNAASVQQGRDGVWVAGGYLHPYDSQETALLSAMEVTQRMGLVPPI